MPQKRKQKEERSHGTRSESRTRSRTSWRKNNDSDNDGKQSSILFGSSPLYLPKKNTGIKSIEISINKTNERFKTTPGPKSENSKSVTVRENKPSSSEEDMFDESKTIGYNNNCSGDNGCEDVRIQAGIMINAHGGRSKNQGGGGPYQYSR